MARQGTYTKRTTPLRRFKWWLRRRWNWFKERTWWQKTLLILAPILAFLLLVPIATYIYFANDISDMDRLMNRNNTGVVLLDKNGTTFYSVGRAEHRTLVPLEDIADSTKQALIASEDKNFYKHGGFSFWSIIRAMYTNLITRDATGYGGSTLTQQLAKNTLLTSKQTFMRKYQELIVATAIEQRYSKDEILMMYLNSVYYGNNSFGIEEAAKNYFNKAPSQLTLAESAMLIGVLPAPSAYSPVTGDTALATGRQAEVLKRMVANNVITEAERTAAIKEEIAYQPPAVINNAAPHYTEMVLRELYERYGEETVTRSGYQVTTSLDLDLQRQANNTVAARMPYIQRMGGSNAGLTAIDPKTGEIRALVGSADWNNPTWGKVNMATTARQPGSSFKPVYYAAALAEGTVTPATIINDRPININGYAPKNATKKNYGDVTIRQSLARSLNIPSVLLMQQFGIKKSVEVAERMGITTLDASKQYGLSLAIGSAEMKLEEITNAYAAFANEGMQHTATTIHAINDKFNKTIYTNKNVAKEVITPQGAFLISSILSDDKARSFMFGNALTVPNKTVAVKTGTTDENRDAWAVGYTPDIAIGVWVGNNNNDVMLSGGADMAAPIWKEVIASAIGSRTPSFSPPSGIVQKPVCSANGGLATAAGSGTYNEYFLTSALPTASCNAAPARPTPPVTPPVEEPETEPVKPPVTPEGGEGGTDPTPPVTPPVTPPTGETGGTTPPTTNPPAGRTPAR